MTQHTIIETLRQAFAEPSPAVRTYLLAYEALIQTAPGMHMTALASTRAAWRALTEDGRNAVDAALDAIPLKVGA